MLRQTTTTLTIETPGRGLHEVTRNVASWVERSGIAEGLLIQENADTDVREDIDRFFARLVPDGDPRFEPREQSAPDARNVAGHLLVGAPAAWASPRGGAAPDRLVIA